MKYFVISDVHSFYRQMRQDLMLAGFRKRNKDHVLIVIGDIFDRGPDAIKTYEYIHSIPKSRRILIKGNHEDLYKELLEKSWPERHDESNMTVDTFCQISGIKREEIYKDSNVWNIIKEDVRNHEITKWLNSDEWLDYYELGPFVFTHSFVPVKVKAENAFAAKIYGEFNLPEHYFEPNPNWRNADSWDWYVARWGAPHRKFREGLFAEKDKTLVVGHWHTAAFFEELKNNWRWHNDVAPIYYSKGLIGVDGGVCRNYLKQFIHPQNVLVIDENWKCYDKFGDELKEEPDPIIIETVELTEEEKKLLEK